MKKIKAKHVLAMVMVIGFIFGLNFQFALADDDDDDDKKGKKTYFKKRGSGYDIKHLVGAWRIVSLRGESENGDEFHPFGEDLNAIVVYTKSGIVSCHLSARNRPSFTVPDRLLAPDEEKLAAWATYDCYSGHFDVHDVDGMEGYVRHYLDTSLYPNWANDGFIKDINFVCDGKNKIRWLGKGFIMNGIHWRWFLDLERVR